MQVNKPKKIYKCPHDRQCKSRCKDCLGYSPNRNKCSRCKKAFIPDETGLQTCENCRYKSNCPHGITKIKDCKQCKREYCKQYRITYKCIHNRRRDCCTICDKECKSCEHKLDRSCCIICTGCIHGKRKNICQICDISGYLISVVRSRVYKALLTDNINKTKQSVEYLGCSIDEYKIYLEQKFKPEMTWENYGTYWHIDHIIPIKYENPTHEEVIERLYFKNTQPLTIQENQMKGNRFIG